NPMNAPNLQEHGANAMKAVDRVDRHRYDAKHDRDQDLWRAVQSENHDQHGIKHDGRYGGIGSQEWFERRAKERRAVDREPREKSSGDGQRDRGGDIFE